MRGVLAAVLAAGLGLGLTKVSASGAEPAPRARALALVVAGDVGAHGDVFSRASGEERRVSADLDVPGLRIREGEALARTDVSDAAAPTAQAVAVARSVSVLDGRVTAYGVRRVLEAGTDGPVYRGHVRGLVIDGKSIGDVEEKKSYVLPDGAGLVLVNTGSIGLRVILDRTIGELEAGTDIRVAVARGSVTALEATPTPTVTPTPTPTATATPEKENELERRPAPDVRRRLTAAGYAFPVYGKVSFSDTFGAPRAAPIVAHEGVDVFAEFGSPVVAVADGVVSKVGTLPISGNRLWVTSENGDAFFYAHLSAFSPAAVDGAKVRAGDVLGFVGNTGDAEPTPPHLHFEVHPGGEDEPAVDPYLIMLAWQGREDVPAGAWLDINGAATTERPGALVAVKDFIAE